MKCSDYKWNEEGQRWYKYGREEKVKTLVAWITSGAKFPAIKSLAEEIERDMRAERDENTK